MLRSVDAIAEDRIVELVSDDNDVGRSRQLELASGAQLESIGLVVTLQSASLVLASNTGLIDESVPVGDAGDDQETNPAHALKPGSICRSVTLMRQRLDV